MILQPDLFSFAYVPDWYIQLDALAEMALPEPWRFRNPIYLTKNPDTPILERYIHAIFKSGGMKHEEKRKKEEKQRLSTRQLMNTKEVTDYSLTTYDGDDLVYFMIRPTNLSVLSDTNVGARIYALMNVLKGVAEIEMLCLNSRESFEENKSFLRSRMEKEKNPVVRKLLEKDQSFLDRIQVQMATAREFLILIRLHRDKGPEVFSYLDRIEKSLKEQGFHAKRAGREDIKRLMAVYYEQNVTSERFEGFDGERWIIPED